MISLKLWGLRNILILKMSCLERAQHVTKRLYIRQKCIGAELKSLSFSLGNTDVGKTNNCLKTILQKK